MTLPRRPMAAVVGSLALLVACVAQAGYYDVVMDDNPVAYWRLDEPSGAQAVDEVSGRVGSIVGGVTLNQPSGLTNEPGNPSMDFRTLAGSDGVVRVPQDAALNPQSFSVELWAKAEGNAGQYRSPLTNRGHSSPPGSGLSGQRGYLFYAASNDRWLFWTGTGAGWSGQTGPAVNLDEWVHLVGTFEPTSGPDAYGILTGTKRFYVNGDLVGSATASYLPNNATDFHIGAGGDGGTSYDFYGDIDEVAVYDYALSPEQVAQHYVTGTPEPASLTLLVGGLALLRARRRRSSR